MPLPTRTDVLTLGFTGAGQPAAYIEAKALSPSSATLGYTLQAQPVFGLPTGVGNVTLLPSLYTNANQFFAATISQAAVLLPSLYTNTNQFFAATILQAAILLPSLYTNANQFFAAVLRGGSPVPLPFHPFCDRGSLTITEAARGELVVAEAPRGSLTIAEAARGELVVSEAPRGTMAVTSAPRRPINPSC